MKKKYNLLFIESGLGYGGSSAFLYYFLPNLNKELFNPIVLFYYQTNGPDVQKIRTQGVEVSSLGVRPHQRIDLRTGSSAILTYNKLLRKFKNYSISLTELITIDTPLVIKLTQIIRKKTIELVVLNNDLQYHLAGVIASKIANVPCICRKAGIGGGERTKKSLARFVDLFIASSKAAAQDYIQDELPTDKLVMIYEGVDLREFNPFQGSRVRRELKIGPDKVIVGSVARLSAGKGHFDLLEAASSVVKTNPNVFFLIVGDAPPPDGSMLEMFKKKAFELGLSRNIIFTGWRTDIPALLSAMDVYVQNSIQPEGLGIAALEAGAMTKPMIVTNAGGLRETIVEGVSGYIIPPEDTNSLISSINRLVNSSNLRNKMGREARKLVEKKFNIENLMREYEQKFLKVLQEHETIKHP